LAYDEDTDTWLKLDVVTDLVYGRPIRCMRLALGSHCLANRHRLEPLTVLAIEDEFFTLLLHCILDKGQFRTGHRKRLKSLGVSITKNHARVQQIREYCQVYLPALITWNRIVQALQNENWQWFINQRAGIVKKIFWQHPAIHSWRWLSNRLIRRLRPLFFMMRRHGLSVALLAPDGAGKSTLAAELTRIDYLRAQMIYMGGNSEAANINLPTTRWLKHRVKSLTGRRPNPKRLFFRGLNFINHLVEQWYRYAVGLYHKILGRFVIYDRYTYDSYLAPPAKSVGKRLRRWLRKKSCPSPNLVLLLDAPGNILFQRKREHSPERLEAQRQVFLGLQSKISNMVVVDATRSVNEVRRDVISKIWKYYGGLAQRLN
jgi:thymidylate kinase